MIGNVNDMRFLRGIGWGLSGHMIVMPRLAFLIFLMVYDWNVRNKVYFFK